MTKTSIIPLCGLVGVLVAGSSAKAELPCPTTPNFHNSILAIANKPATGPTGYQYIVGNFDFFGSSVVGACIGSKTPSEAQVKWSLHFIVNSSNNGLLSYLPQFNNNLCLGGEKDDVTIVTQAVSTPCGITMNPLNYAGNRFAIYTQGGADHVDGGNGIEFLYGGTENDDFSDGGALGAGGLNPIYAATLMGESGNDFLHGSQGNASYLDGGNDRDGIADVGGSGDSLYGGPGDDCCLWDSNEQYASFNCGSGGSDKVNNLSGGKQSCELTSPNCNASLLTCFGAP